MSRALRLVLRPGQLSALVCSGVLDQPMPTDLTVGEMLVRAGVRGDTLVVGTGRAALVADALTEMANSEHETSERSTGPARFLAARACTELTKLAARVRRMRPADMVAADRSEGGA